MKPHGTLSRWLHPDRAPVLAALLSASIILLFVLACAADYIRFRQRRAHLPSLVPGQTRDQVIAVLGQPSLRSESGTLWIYDGSALPMSLRFLSSNAPPIYVEFAADGMFQSARVYDYRTDD